MDDTKHALVTTTDTVVKEGNTGIVDRESKSKQNFVEENHHSSYTIKKEY